MTIKTKDNGAAFKTRAFALEIKAQDDAAGTFEGYASVFGVRDSYNEVVQPGAFSESLARHKREGTFPLMLWQHDPWEVVGKWSDLSDDGKGLWGKGKLLLELQRGKETHILLREKAISGLSIGYREVDVEPAKDGEPRKLIKLDLMEVSVVSFPANRRARVDAVKGDDQEAINKWKRFEDWVRRVCDDEIPPPNDFEEVLRDARASKSQRARIASRMHAVLRSESGGGEANKPAVVDALSEFRKRLDGFTLPKLKEP